MRIPLLAGLTLLVCGQASANEKLTTVLDWYINPDHAPIMVAEQIGAFRDAGLDVNIIPPSDPALPPRLVAARQADLAITYQPQVHFFADEGLPLVRVGTLIHSPLNTVIALDPRIKSPADLQGKKVGYSVSGIEQATLATMAQHANIAPDSIKLINVNFQLTSALLAGGRCRYRRLSQYRSAGTQTAGQKTGGHECGRLWRARLRRTGDRGKQS